MTFLDPKFPGTAYGMATITEDGEAGQVVKVSGHDEVALNDAPSVRSFGILYKKAKANELCTVLTDGGIYETDNYPGAINPGELLKVDATNKNLTAGVGASDIPIAEAISVVSDALRFKLLI